MVVDAHVNVDSQRFPVERALSVLRAARIEHAVIFADPRAADKDETNRYVLQVAREHDLFPFYYLGGNPFTDTRPDNLELPDDIERYAGFRWHRWVAEGVDREGSLDEDELTWAVSLMESPEFEAMASAASLYSMPVMFEESFAVTLEFVLRYPALDVIVPHLGARNGGQTNILRALWDQPSVYLETSLSQVDETVLARIGTERILFGSCYPYGDPEIEIQKIDTLPIAEEAKEGMYSDNILHLLSAYLERNQEANLSE
ncbi:MAG TPA: amidohydrolase family protein [Chloroflexota bacterium]